MREVLTPLKVIKQQGKEAGSPDGGILGSKLTARPMTIGPGQEPFPAITRTNVQAGGKVEPKSGNIPEGKVYQVTPG